MALLHGQDCKRAHCFCFLLNRGAAVVVSCSSRVSVSARLQRRSDSRRKIEHGTPQAVSCGCFTASPAPHGALGGVTIARSPGSTTVARVIDPGLAERDRKS